jgi:HEAT repeat protein
MNPLRALTAACLFFVAFLTLSAQTPSSVKPLVKPQPVVTEISGKSFDQWKLDLKHQDASTRTEAILAIAMFGPAASDTVPLLLDRCLDKDGSPRVKAVVALSVIEVPQKYIPQVVRALARRIGQEEAQSIIRYQALVSLERFADDPTAREAIGALIYRSEDPSSYEIRRLCLSLLRRLGRQPEGGSDLRVINAFMRAAHDVTSQVRLEGAIGLGVMGRPPDPVDLGKVERTLITLTHDRDKVVALWAQVSLLALSPKVSDEKIAALGRNLDSPDMRLRQHAARALGVMGDKARHCVPMLLKALDDKQDEVVTEVCTALAAIHDPAPQILSALTELSQRKGLDEAVKTVVMASIEQVKKPKEKPNEKPKDKK